MADSLILSVREGLRGGWPKLLRSRRTRTAADARLVNMLEAEIIPRLAVNGVATDADAVAGSDAGRAPPIDEAEVGRLTTLLLRQDTRSAWQLVEALQSTGHGLEDIYLDLLAPAARRMGDLWTEDVVDFTAVTLATGYLQELLRSLSLRHDGGIEFAGHHHRILLQPATGEHHGLGISILGELFRRRGWDVCGGPSLGRDRLRDVLSREHFDVVGFSLAADRWLEGLAEDIACVRACSRNESVRILVGGEGINQMPQLVAELGADGTASDARRAPDTALSLLDNGSAAGHRD